MARRSQLIPWKLAGRITDQLASGDEVVQTSGWLFNSTTHSGATLADFVETGDHEVAPFLMTFGLDNATPDGRMPERQRLVEIGAGIGRMTCAFTRTFGEVTACDIDAGFLERCYETVGRFGRVDRLRTSQVHDGHTIDLADDSVDLTFSYLTMQHCCVDDALDLSQESVRITRPGGKIALNYRARSAIDPFVMGAGRAIRQFYRVPGLGSALTRSRPLTRMAWQASRLHPDQVTGQLGDSIVDITIWTNPTSQLCSADGATAGYEGVNPRHWWIVATVA